MIAVFMNSKQRLSQFNVSPGLDTKIVTKVSHVRGIVFEGVLKTTPISSMPQYQYKAYQILKERQPELFSETLENRHIYASTTVEGEVFRTATND